MEKEKLYFTRYHDQWKGKSIAIEGEIEGYGLYVQTPDIDISEGSVNSINATFKNEEGKIYSVGCEIYDDAKRIFRIKMPTFILANKGLYEVTFSISYNSSNSINRTEKTAIQTFSILDTIEVDDDEAIENDDRYSILTQLIDEIAQYKIDTSSFVNKEDVQEMIEDATEDFSIESIKTQLEGTYITPKQLNDNLKNYVSNFDSAKFALSSDLNYYVKNIDLNNTLSYYSKKEDLNKYVLKENGKSLTSNDFTNELHDKVVNMPDYNELNQTINKKADIDWVTDKFKDVGAFDKENYYDITTTDEMLNEIKTNHITDINNLSNTINTEYLKKEDYEYLDGINIDDIKVNDNQTLTQLIEDIGYKEIEILDFYTSYISNIKEQGTSIGYIDFYWKLNKNPISQSLTDYSDNIDNAVRDAYINNSYSLTKTFTLTVSDERVTKSANITFYFVNPYLYGSYIEDELSDDAIKFGSEIIDIKNNQTIRLSYKDAGVFFAYPYEYGYLEDIKDGNGLSYFDDFIMETRTINNITYNVYILKDKATVPQISFSFIFRKEEE